ncbi:winged helix-turn-helix domain-containing protein [Paenibacillus sp. CAA11]|uniref:DNA glycosylase AlkZ-like family protein n=1 Tax=Paenibacillus sp. CAA11 TaxID=1532905 RepID=UPI000D3A959D|nr:crosslink repair DNA glycosylase YcaQ family protein [Paenibacillus sp. CAA11]AWB43647.1 winged helix-turn-helix domain-containing protein [Paenibacillus sp. CAA11]
MRAPLQIDRSTVRRFLLKVQQLTEENPNPSGSGEQGGEEASALELIRTLGAVQIDPVAAVTGNQHLALSARSAGYRQEHLSRLLAQNRVFEYFANAACVIPMEDYAIFEPTRARLRSQLAGPLHELGDVVKQVKDRLRAEGPLPSRAFRSEKRVHGYWDAAAEVPKTKATSLALNLLLDTGELRVVARQGTERYFHLAELTIEESLLNQAREMDLETAGQALTDKYIRAYRIIDARDPRLGWRKTTAAERRRDVQTRLEAGRLVALSISGLPDVYYVGPEDAEALRDLQLQKESADEPGPVRFLPPLDNLLWRRERVADLFDFEYKWEIYTPEAKRRYGYYAMPILDGEHLIGRMDPRLDRKNKLLTVQLLQLEEGYESSPDRLYRIWEGLQSFAARHGAAEVRVERTMPEGVMLLSRFQN